MRKQSPSEASRLIRSAGFCEGCYESPRDCVCHIPMLVTDRLAMALVQAGVETGLERGWALEIAYNLIVAMHDGMEDPLEAAYTMLLHRMDRPGAGRPACYHALLPQLPYDALRIAQAIAHAYFNEQRKGTDR